MNRTVFFVSDRTGLTAESLGRSLLTQFEAIHFRQVSLPFIDDRAKALGARAQIDEAARADGARPLVFSTLVDADIRALVAAGNSMFIDFFDAFIGPLERELSVTSTHAVGRSHGLVDNAKYSARMDAVNFALGADDGVGLNNYGHADIILIGVSRSGKTPTCLYLALQYGLYAANYPITDRELDATRLPEALLPFRAKLFGLTIDPERLRLFRQERRPDSGYASMRQCRYEVGQVEALYRREGIPNIDTSAISIEEIAATILHLTGLERRVS